MDQFQEQLGTILQNPEMMQKIMTMAQSLSETQPHANAQAQSAPSQAPIPDIDPGMLQKLSGIAGQSSIDKNQQNLLTALAPYLSNERIGKLEKAMRAAKMASMASVFLGNSNPFFSMNR